MTVRKFIHALSVAAGLILLWRGIWHGADTLETFFESSPAVGALVSVIVGLGILYLPDHDLKEIEKL